MTDYNLNHTRILNEKVHATLRRLDEAEARTHELREEVERLRIEHQRLLEQLCEQDEDLSPSQLPTPDSEIAT